MRGRPFFKASVHELEQEFSVHQSEPAVLQELASELFHRKTPAAVRLRRLVEERLAICRGDPVTDQRAVAPPAAPTPSRLPRKSTTRFCGWASLLPELVECEPQDILMSLRDFIRDATPEQDAAWQECVDVLQVQGAQVLRLHPPAERYGTLLEYELPRQGGRRPDVIVLQNGLVVVVEFKQYGSVRWVDIDQVAAYARDLRNYHSACHDLEVLPVLVLGGRGAHDQRVGEVDVLAPASLGRYLIEKGGSRSSRVVDIHTFLEGVYAPLPALVESARLIFQNKPLPFIRRAQSAGVHAAVHRILSISAAAQRDGRRCLALLAGVPGAGKTLVGLQVAHAAGLDGLASRGRRQVGAPATFLSGNGPLVQVLQHALGTTTFVRDMHAFVNDMGFKRPDVVPSEHVIVFDEAQRAWDSAKIADFHGKRPGMDHIDIHRSEPEILVGIADRIPDWALLLALVGEGQEIHVGEEAGTAQWAGALALSQQGERWSVVGPSRLAPMFAATGLQYFTDDALDLDITLRSHAAEDLHRWVGRLLDDGVLALPETRRLAERLRRDAFPLYVTRDLEAARGYARQRFGGEPDRRFGLLTSSKARNLFTFGLDPGWEATRRIKIGPWYNDPPDSSRSCCKLDIVITEFQAQGLELDFPIVCWGDDFTCVDDRWQMRPGRPGRLVRDPFRLRTNAYRVLLTRGREGMIVFVPPGAALDATFQLLVKAGMVPVRQATEQMKAG